MIGPLHVLRPRVARSLALLAAVAACGQPFTAAANEAAPAPGRSSGTPAIVCGDANEDGATTASDALAALHAAVGTRPCQPCICDADGSGAHVATDALAVLSAAIGIDVALACPICSDDAVIGFELESATPCRGGVHIEVPREALPDDLRLISCLLQPAPALPDCSGSATVGETGLVVDVRGTGCNLGGELFQCRMPPGLAPQIALQAELACGCGCQPCPPSLELCTTGTSTSCSNAWQPPVFQAAEPRTTKPQDAGTIRTRQVTQTSSLTNTPVVQSSSSTTHCGTCCGADDFGYFDVTDDVVITELSIVVDGNVLGGDCLYCYMTGDDDELDAEADGPLSFCLFDAAGIQAPAHVAYCSGGGTVKPETTRATRALGANFEPLSPLPEVVLNPDFP